MSGPLSSLKVLDFSTLLPGPFASLLLADMGADVLRVESPTRMDLVRVLPPHDGGTSTSHAYLNRNKRSIALDLKRAEALADASEAAHYRLWAGLSAGRAGQHELARTTLDSVLADPAATSLNAGMARAAKVQLLAAEGHWRRATEQGEAECRVLRDEGLHVTAATLGLTLAEAHLHDARPARARGQLQLASAVFAARGYAVHRLRVSFLMGLAMWEGGARQEGQPWPRPSSSRSRCWCPRPWIARLS